MTDDIAVPDPPNRKKEAAFYGFVAILMVAVFGGAAYFLGAFDSSKTKTPDTAPGPNLTSGPSSPTAHGPASSKAAAVAVVRKSFQLTEARKYAAACALESPTYLKFDAANYSHKSCAAELQAVSEQLRAQGISMQMKNMEVLAFGDGQARVLARITVGGKAAEVTFFLRYHGSRWWVTGGDDSGDLGY